jgi:hypothetical protein
LVAGLACKPHLYQQPTVVLVEAQEPALVDQQLQGKVMLAAQAQEVQRGLEAEALGLPVEHLRLVLEETEALVVLHQSLVRQ